MKRFTLFLRRTLGSLALHYYITNFLFAGLLFVGVLFVTNQSGNELSDKKIIFLLVCTFLYPYSRFIYEKITGLFGGNFLIINALFLFIPKLLGILLCWIYAMFIAPIGLMYLYYYHSHTSRLK